MPSFDRIRVSLAERGRRILTAGAVAVGLCAGCGWPGAEPPNLVVVVLDTLRADRLGLYGYERGTSPEIDGMFSEGVVFENAQTASPWTAPALISLMTSLYPTVHQVKTFPRPKVLSPEATTLAEVVKRAGYATAAFTEGGYAKGEFGLAQGMDVYPTNEGDDWSHRSHEYFPSRLEENLTRALDWMGQQANQPFFMLFHTYEPHYPLRAPESFVRALRPSYDEDEEHRRFDRLIGDWNQNGRISREAATVLLVHTHHCYLVDRAKVEDRDAFWKAAGGIGWGKEAVETSADFLEWIWDLYDAEVAYSDYALGRLWRALQAEPFDNTIVILVSDHGEALGDHGKLRHGSTLYEELLHMALAIRVPGEAWQPRRVTAVVRSIDVMPTALELLGLDSAGLGLQGRSLVPLMRGDPLPELPALGHGRTVKGRPDTLYSLRTNRWRLIVDRDAGATELYDLRADPDEARNLAAELPDQVARLRAELEQSLTADGERLTRFAPDGDEGAPIDPALARQLEALGYIGDAVED